MYASVRESSKKELYYCQEDFVFGGECLKISLAGTDEGLCRLGLGDGPDAELRCRKWAARYLPGCRLVQERTPLSPVLRQLEEYFSGIRKEFEVPLILLGTEFQIRVWQELRRISYGNTVSYGEIAKRIGCPKGPRAVGMANNRNPIGIIVPCHRVIGQNGSLVGYGAGLPLKEKLLAWESACSR